MSPDVLTRIHAELDRLDAERGDMEPLFSQLVAREPTAIEIRAVATTLHSLFTGMESILKMIMTLSDGAPVEGALWHSSLLKQAAEVTGNRGPIIEKDLYVELRELMAFRHVFRNAYGHQLLWPEMKDIALRAFGITGRFKLAVNVFLEGRE